MLQKSGVKAAGVAHYRLKQLSIADFVFYDFDTQELGSLIFDTAILITRLITERKSTVLTHQTPRSHIWDRNAISSQRIKEHEIALLSISAPLGQPKETRNAEFLVSPKKVTWSGAAIFRMFVILPFAAGLFRKWSLLLLV